MQGQVDLFSWSTPTPQCDRAVADHDKTADCASLGEYPALNPFVTPNKSAVRGAGCGDPRSGNPAVRRTSAEGLATAGPTAGECRVENRTAGRTVSPPRLRTYQLAGIEAIETQWARGCRRTLLELPTGTGKTVCFAELARRTVARGKRALVVAHRTELLKQARKKLLDVGVVAAIEQAAQRAGRAPVIVASQQSLKGARLEALDPSEFGLLVIDEGHHAVARGYRAILDRFAGVDTVLVTATPDRADGRGLKEVCSSVAYRYEMRAAIRDQWLVPIRAKRIVVEGLDLASVKSHHGDFDERELAAVMQQEKVLHGVVAPLLEQAGERRTIAFAVNVAHAYAVASVLNRHRPGCARAIDGEASAEEREETLRAFTAGEYQFLVNCALYTEGFDEPSIACVAILRPTQSRALFCQMLGRGTRLLGDTYELSCAAGKRDVLVLDFTSNSSRHRLAGPGDALAGQLIAEELREDVERDLDLGQLELESILAKAERLALIKREQARLTALALYRTYEVDPFMVLGPEPDAAWASELATEKQRRALQDQGMKLPPDLTRGEASRYVEALRVRKQQGLCSYKAAKRLASLGLNVAGMTQSRAAALFQKLRKRGWGKWVVQHEPEFRRSK